ncbi:hypothetical protein H3H51_15770 [Pseudomonas sp. UL070]|uniref:Uncharacterized protein n=1 Tax=Aquipseudomonas ullengensis TaxID=2759166 RepID=A0A7W4QBA8_9GAMM|nr:hypothetical protein [Pseudomonas ullengensis]
MLKQLVYAVTNTGSFAQHNTTGCADIFFYEVEAIPHVNTHFLKNFVRNPDGAITIPILNYHLRYRHLSGPQIAELTPWTGGVSGSLSNTSNDRDQIVAIGSA